MNHEFLEFRGVSAEETGELFQLERGEMGNFHFPRIEIERIEKGHIVYQERFARKISPLSKQCMFSEVLSKHHEIVRLTHT